MAAVYLTEPVPIGFTNGRYGANPATQVRCRRSRRRTAASYGAVRHARGIRRHPGGGGRSASWSIPLARGQRRCGCLAWVLVSRRLQAHRGERPTHGAAPALTIGNEAVVPMPLAVTYPVPVASIESSMPADRLSAPDAPPFRHRLAVEPVPTALRFASCEPGRGGSRQALTISVRFWANRDPSFVRGAHESPVSRTLRRHRRSAHSR